MQYPPLSLHFLNGCTVEDKTPSPPILTSHPLLPPSPPTLTSPEEYAYLVVFLKESILLEDGSVVAFLFRVLLFPVSLASSLLERGQ